MTDHTTIQRLRAAMAAEARGHHLPAGAARSAAAEAGFRRGPRRELLAVAAVGLVVAGLGVVVAVRNPGQQDDAARSACQLVATPLPVWARDGFSPDAVDTPHVVGSHGRIVAIPFVTLRAHQRADTANKVLWVAKDGSNGPLHVRAVLAGRTVTRTLALGPGYLDLPAAGCWHLDLSWPGQRDDLDLAYAP